MLEFLQTAKVMLTSVFEAIMPGVPLGSGQTPLWPVAATFCVCAVAMLVSGFGGDLLEGVWDRYSETLRREHVDVVSSRARGSYPAFVSGISSFDGKRAVLGGAYLLWSVLHAAVVFYLWVSFLLMTAWAPVAIAAAFG